MIVEPGHRWFAVVDERGDPSLLGLVRRQRAQHPVGELLQLRVNLGEVRIKDLDSGPVPDEPSGDHLAGTAAEEDGRWQQAGGVDVQSAQVVPVHGADHCFLAGVSIDADQPQVVGVLVAAE